MSLSQLSKKEPEKCYTCRTRRNPPFHKEELYAFPIPLWKTRTWEQKKTLKLLLYPGSWTDEWICCQFNMDSDSRKYPKRKGSRDFHQLSPFQVNIPLTQESISPEEGAPIYRLQERDFVPLLSDRSRKTRDMCKNTKTFMTYDVVHKLITFHFTQHKREATGRTTSEFITWSF